MESEKLGSKIKALRTLRGMSQEYLAEEAHVGLRTIQRIEKCESQPTGETIKRIATALGADLEELLGPNSLSETRDLNATIVFLKKKRRLTSNKSESQTFGNFIDLLESLKEKELKKEQLEVIHGYIQYLELEKIPSFRNELFKQKLKKFRAFLRSKLRFVPNNLYLHRAVIFGVPFAVAFSVQPKIHPGLRIGVAALALLAIGLASLLDRSVKKQNRSLRF